MSGFYEGGRPLNVDLPHYQQTVHALLGGLLSSAKPTLEQQWAAEAEVRMIAAQAIQARLPWDSPPELVELAMLDDKGEEPAAVKEYMDALSSAGMA
jgi:hypothetical protein